MRTFAGSNNENKDDLTLPDEPKQFKSQTTPPVAQVSWVHLGVTFVWTYDQFKRPWSFDLQLRVCVFDVFFLLMISLRFVLNCTKPPLQEFNQIFL